MNRPGLVGQRGSPAGITWGLRGTARWLLASTGLLGASLAFAAGTPAGALINNSVIVSYIYAGTPASQQATAIPIRVAQSLSVRATWQDATPTPSNSPDTLRVLTFAVTNLGNGTDTLVLSRDNAIAGDQLDPTDSPQGGIWLESGAQPGLQVSGPNADVLYVPGANDPVLAPDASRTVYLASSIGPGFTTGASARATLTARSTRAPLGTVAGQQVGLDAGVPLVAGPGGGRSTAQGAYLVTTVALGLTKAVVGVADTQGGNRVMAGSTITYRLTVTAGGAGNAANLVVTDPLPATLTYVPGSITVDGVARTDAADGDDSSFSASTVRTVLPSITAPQNRVIEFKATVN